MKTFLSILSVTFIFSSSLAFASESKVICGSDTDYYGPTSFDYSVKELNQGIAQSLKDGYTVVSAPSIAYSASSGHEGSTACVTVTKP